MCYWFMFIVKFILATNGIQYLKLKQNTKQCKNLEIFISTKQFINMFPW